MYPPSPAARLGAVVLAIVVYYYVGEKIPIDRGYGYDGTFYAAMVEAFPGWVDSYADAYRLQRVLPSWICGAALRLLGVAPEPRAVVLAFVTLNAAALLGSFVAMLGIARGMGFDRVRTTALFLVTFVTYASVKLPSFHPVLTDFTAAALGFGLTYFYVCRRTVALATCTVAGAFTWPTLPLLGLLYLAFPLGTRVEMPGALARCVRRAVPVGLGTGFVALAFYIYEAEHPPHWVFGPSRPMPWAGVVLAVGYLAAGVWCVCRAWPTRDGAGPGVTLRAIPWRTLAAAVVLVGTVRLLQDLATTENAVLTLPQFLIRIVACATERPLGFVVAHVAFFGPAFLLLILGFPRLCREAAAAGPGVQLALGAFVIFTLFSESRSFTPWWGPIGVFAVKSGGLWSDRRILAPLAALQAWGTQVWLPAGLFRPDSPIAEFPAQWYFMNFGPWMNDAAFMVLAAYTVVVGAGLLWYMRSWPEPRVPRPMRLAFAIAGLTAGAALSLEVAARAGLALSLSTLGADPRCRYHPELGWELRPSAGDVNADGFRGPLPARTDGGRILLLGDAVVDAPDLPDAETLRGRLAPRLAPTEVLNGGVSGYSTDQQLLSYRARGRGLRPDVVILAFFHDDVAGNTLRRWGQDRKPRFVLAGDRLDLEPLPDGPGPVFPHRRPPRPHAWLPWRGSLALRALSNATLHHVPAAHAVLAGWGVTQATEVPVELRPYGWRQDQEGAWRLTLELLRALQQDVRDDGGALLVLYVPASFELDDAAWEATRKRYAMTGAQWSATAVAQRLQASCRELALPLLDPRAELAAARDSGHTPYTSAGALAPAGHAALARTVVAALSGRSGPVLAE